VILPATAPLPGKDRLLLYRTRSFMAYTQERCSLSIGPGLCGLRRTPSARSSQNTPPPRSYKATPVVTGENGAAGEIVPEVAPPQILRIRHVEGGEMKPRITTLYKLAQGLEVDPAELVSE
jgi:hypothetical protein